MVLKNGLERNKILLTKFLLFLFLCVFSLVGKGGVNVREWECVDRVGF